MPENKWEVVDRRPLRGNEALAGASPSPVPLAPPPPNPAPLGPEEPQQFQPPDVETLRQTWKTLSPVQQKAIARGLGINTEINADTMETEIANAKSDFAGTVAETVVPATVAAASGPMAPLTAMAMMGAAGAGVGAIKESAKLGILPVPGMNTTAASDAAMSPAQVARRLSVDATLGTVTEGGGRLTGKLLEIAGNSYWKPMIARAAEKSEAGDKLLREYGALQLDQIRNRFAMAGYPRRAVTLQPEISTLEATVAKSETGTSKAFKDAFERINVFIREWGEQGSPSAGIVKLKGDISQVAYGENQGLHYTEKLALEKFADAIDQKAARTVRAVTGPEGLAQYNAYKEVQNQLFKNEEAMKAMASFVKRFAYRTAYGFALGSGASIAGGAGMGAMIGGAGIGAGVGALSEAAFAAFERRIAPALLEEMLFNKTSATATKQALKLMDRDPKAARQLLERAALQIGAHKWVSKAAQAWVEENVAMQRAELEARTPKSPAPVPLPAPGQ